MQERKLWKGGWPRALYARSVSNLVWRANRVTGASGFDVDFCESVKIEQ